MDDVDEDRTRRIAELARLELEDDEVRGLARELESILGHFEDLSAVEPASGRASVHGDLSPRLRADVPSADPLARGPEEMAPDWRDGFFVLPRLSAMGPDGSDDAA
jgi:aspartyl/glutamyl-tRNA(Asn/Gln) amidotransferase C subunit